MTKKYFVTGGAGFIGSNYVADLIRKGQDVTVYDNLSRAGAVHNIEWLTEQFGKDAFRLIVGDVRDGIKLMKEIGKPDVVAHFAGQVAVTTSVLNPREDFEINALGTFNVLEAVRNSGGQPVVLYTSTNKVYGGMEDVRVEEGETRYRYLDYPNGIPESRPLDFHSPYGCSKGTGDQYMRDYARIYGIPTVVFRQSAIYGTRQFGIEDQGWVSWFIIAVLTKKPLTIYGDGKQVRDLLFVDDLVRAYHAAVERPEAAAGQIFNIGGGAERVLSVWKEFGPILEELAGRKIDVQYGDWRPGDQVIYVSDITKAEETLDWEPRVSVRAGIEMLWRWASENQRLFN